MSGLAVWRFGGLMLLGAVFVPTAEPPNRPSAASLTIGRLHYDGGGDWYANPSSLPNLLTALRERTTLPVAERERVVTLTGPELWEVPYIYMTGHGNVHFSDVEIRNLRRYLEQGGFLHADDNYGMNVSFRREIARVFPDHPHLQPGLRLPAGHSQDPRARRSPRAGLRHFFGRPPCRILFLSVGPRGRLGGPRRPP